MRRLVALLALAGGFGWSQQVRREVVKPTTPAEDSRPNSDQVPEVFTVPARLERLLVLRFKYQADLLGGLENAVQRLGVRNAVILAGAGSVRGYHVHAVSNRTFPSKNIYVRDPSAPADIVSMNGYVLEGRVHAHVTLADADRAFGGHLEPGTEVFTFAIVTLGVLADTPDLRRLDDKTWR